MFISSKHNSFIHCCEGDFIELEDNSIFEVKGFLHPPDKLIVYPRYIPDLKGDRIRKGLKYRKVYPLKERHKILKQRYSDLLIHDPVFGMIIPEISIQRISKFHKPEKFLNELLNKENISAIEKSSIELVKLLSSNSHISLENFGISGSIMVETQIDPSDIDIIVYGKSEGRIVRQVVLNLLKRNKELSSFNIKEIRNLYRTRIKNNLVPFELYENHERRKSIQGKFNGKEFFIRYVPKISEITEKYGDCKYESLGSIRVEADIIESSESYFTPSKYLLDRIKFLAGKRVENLIEVVSLRGRFCEQALQNERVIISGKLEKVSSSSNEYFRVYLGSQDSDYMFSI